MIDISAFELMFHQLSKVDELTDRWLSEIAVAKALKIEVKDLKLYLSKSCHYNDICTDGEKNQTGCFRILKTIGKPRFRHSFFYFEKLQRPDFKLPPPMWYEIYLNTKDFRISTRGKNVDLPAETLFSKTTSTGSSHQRQTGNQQQHQTRRDTFEFKLTRDIFAVNSRQELELRVQAITDALDNGKIEYFLSPPHESRKHWRISPKKVLQLSRQLRYLCAAYAVALEEVGSDFSWANCCSQALNGIHDATGEKTVASSTLQKWNRQFRTNSTLKHPFQEERCYRPYIFAHYPFSEKIARKELQKMLRKEELSSENAANYFQDEFLNEILKEEYNSEWETLNEDQQQSLRVQLRVQCNLKDTPCSVTAWRWIKYLGFSFKTFGRSYYTDGHEREEQKKHRVAYAKKIQANEIRKYRWVQLTQSQRDELESDPEDPLKKQPTRAGQRNGEDVFEYHVMQHPKLCDYISAANKEQHGGDLSIDIGGQRPIIEVGQDESIFAQLLFSNMSWQEDGKSTPRPKSEGETQMESTFIGPSIGFGFNTKEITGALRRINALRAGQKYADEESAMEVRGTVNKTIFETWEEVQRTLSTRFNHGKNRDGYWNCARMSNQTEDVVDILAGMFPDHDLEIHFDNSSGHTKQRKNALNVHVMNVNFGGKQPPMRSSVLTEGSLGPYESKLHPGQTQDFTFKDGDPGPYHLTPDEQKAQKLDIYTSKMKQVLKTKAELRRDLKLGRTTASKKDLQKKAQEANIPLHKEEDVIIEGWVNKGKGLKQVL